MPKDAEKQKIIFESSNTSVALVDNNGVVLGVGAGNAIITAKTQNGDVSESINIEVYSPVMNKSINNKAAMTEEENNCLAEKIVAADIERLWNSDYTVMCPEQSAIGTMCEISVLYGWKYMAEKLLNVEDAFLEEHKHEFEKGDKETCLALINEMHNKVWEELRRILDKKNYAHYFDIRTNHLNEKDWRRSFSINQMLYGIILYATADHTLHNSFDELLPILKEEMNHASSLNQP